MRRLVALCGALLAAAVAGTAQPDFSSENATRILRDLSVEIGPRPMGSPAEQRALAYACASFLRSGCDTAYILPMTASSRANTTSGVAVGIRRGATGRMIVIGGHIDSAGPEIPGADDDGSGSAVVMELARVLSQRPMRSTMVYCCYGGEEEGLEGSRYFAENFPGIDSVAVAFQVDMANGLGTIELDPDTHGRSAPAWLVRATIEEFRALGYGGLEYPTHFFSMNYAMRAGSGSDHESFLAQGIPAIDLTTDVSKPIHTPRDNFENFDPRGLKRSGDVFCNLARRFDGGVPDRTTEHYWLMLLPGPIPVFVPFWGLWLFAFAAAAAAIGALVPLRRDRLPRSDPSYAGWSVLKLWPAVVLIASAAWLSSDLIGALRGIRHPWFTAIQLYALFGALTALVAALLMFRRYFFRLTRDPYPLFRAAAILLVAATGLCAAISVKLVAEPAAGLLLLSLALLFRHPLAKLLFWLAAPVWLLRLVFSEWGALLFRSSTLGFPPNLLTTFILDGLMILLLSLLLFPFLLGAVALCRQSAALERWTGALARPGMVAAAGVAWLLFAGLLFTLPAYNRLWYRDVRVDERFDMGTGLRTVGISSSEYLAGMRVRRGGEDSLISGRTTQVELAPKEFDTTWVGVSRTEAPAERDSATSRFATEITLRCATRPYMVAVRYARTGAEMGPVESHWMSYRSRGEQVLNWRYFPDSVLTIPVRFAAAHGDSVTETIEVTFDRLADPVGITQELAYTIPRTTFVATHVYR